MDLVGNGFRSWSSLVMTTGGGVSVSLCASRRVQTAFNLDWGQAEIASVGKVANAIAWVRVSWPPPPPPETACAPLLEARMTRIEGGVGSCEGSSLLHFVTIRKSAHTL